MGNPVTNITFENGNLVIEKVKGDPVTVKISSPLDAYPVGSFYFSQNSTNPATLFGGTWEQLEQGRVLLSQGTNYPAGSKGGEATHTLTVAEMPVHRHTGLDIDNVYVFGWDTGSLDGANLQDLNTRKKTSNRITTGYTGGGNAHNNLPPYLSVYVWLRTA